VDDRPRIRYLERNRFVGSFTPRKHRSVPEYLRVLVGAAKKSPISHIGGDRKL
jgi:hypothetical protein